MQTHSPGWTTDPAQLPYTNNQVVIAQESLLATIFRLRYSRYVREQGKAYPSVGPPGQLVDPIDRHSLNLAYLGSRGDVVHAVRLSWLCSVTQSEYLSPLAAMVADRVDRNATIVCSRFVSGARTELRSIVALFRAAFAIGLACNATHSVLSTRHELAPLFARFGYVEAQIGFTHPCSGEQTIMVFRHHDRMHLQSISSPNLSVLDAYIADSIMQPGNRT